MPILRVRDLMTPHVFSVRPEDSVEHVRELMDAKHIRHVPVLEEDGSLAGLVSERDLLRRAPGAEAELPLSAQADVFTAVRVSEIMTWEVETVAGDEDAAAAAQVMLDNKYGCLPVVDGGTLVGILTEADFVRFVAASGDSGERRPPKRQARPRNVRH